MRLLFLERCLLLRRVGARFAVLAEHLQTTITLNDTALRRSLKLQARHCPSVCLFVCMSVRLFVCISVRLFVCRQQHFKRLSLISLADTHLPILLWQSVVKLYHLESSNILLLSSQWRVTKLNGELSEVSLNDVPSRHHALTGKSVIEPGERLSWRFHTPVTPVGVFEGRRDHPSMQNTAVLTEMPFSLPFQRFQLTDRRDSVEAHVSTQWTSGLTSFVIFFFAQIR